MWLARSVQLVWFCSNPLGLEGPAIYRHWFNDEPDTSQRTKAAQGVPSSVARGQVAEFNATVQVTPGRVDFVVSPEQSEDAIADRPLAPVDTMLKFALDVSTNAATDLGEVSRLSIIAVLDLPSEGRSQSNETFKSLSGLSLPDGVSDLVFQFGNPTHGKLPHNTGLNRVIKISVVAQRAMLIKVNASFGDGASERVPLGADQWSTLVQLDFNTVPDGKTYSAAEQHDLLDAIRQEIISIAQEETLASVLS